MYRQYSGEDTNNKQDTPSSTLKSTFFFPTYLRLSFKKWLVMCDLNTFHLTPNIIIVIGL